MRTSRSLLGREAGLALLGALLDDLLPLRVNLLIVDVARSLALLALGRLRVVRCFARGWNQLLLFR